MEARLVVVRGKASKREIPLKLPTIIGRSRQADLPVAHPLVSRQHCQIFERDGGLVVKDNGSLNGTFVGGQKVTEVVLRPGDELTVGPLTFRVMYEPAPDVFPGLDATATPADDSTVARPETPESAFVPPVLVPPSVESAAPADGPNPFDFLESDAAAAAPADIEPPVAEESPAEVEPSAVAPQAEPAFDEAPEITPPAPATPAPENTLPWLQDDSSEEPGQERTIQAAAFINLKAPPPEVDKGSAKSSAASGESPAAADAADEPAGASENRASENDEDFFASLGQQVDAAPAAGAGETEFWTAPPVEPDVRDDDSTIIEPESAADEFASPADEGPPSVAPKGSVGPKDKDKPKKKSGGWWPFGKKKAEPKPKGKPGPVAKAPLESEPTDEDDALPPNEPEVAAIPAPEEPAAAASPAAAPPSADDDVIIGLPAAKKPDDALADDMVAGWLSQSEEPEDEPVAAKDDDLNDFLKNFNK